MGDEDYDYDDSPSPSFKVLKDGDGPAPAKEETMLYLSTKYSCLVVFWAVFLTLFSMM